MLTVFITSNQIPLHVYAVFCQLHVHCIHLARGMMRMRIPSIPIKYTPPAMLLYTVDTRKPTLPLCKHSTLHVHVLK